MFSRLPEPIKRQVEIYLLNDNFPAAKKLYDSWLNHHEKPEDSYLLHEEIEVSGSREPH